MPLKVLDYVSRKHCIKGAKGINLFAIQHILDDSVDFFKYLADQQFARIIVIGIPYSFKKEPGEKLRSLGIEVVCPPFDNIYGAVEKMLLNELKDCRANGKKLLILEDGGYAAPLLHNVIFKDQIPNCLGAVEQTKNGLWRNQEITNLGFPIVHVAESKLKDAVEAPAVGEAVARTLEDFLGESGVSISRLEIGVLGYGAVGSNIAKRLSARKAKVSVNDVMVQRNIAARLDEFRVPPRAQIISQSDLIVGAAGRTSISRDDLLCLKHGAYVASASSKNVEIDVKELALVSKKEEDIHAEIKEHTLLNDRAIRVFSEGFPINFRGKFSVPNDVMDLILSELYASMHYLAGTILPIGIHLIPCNLENEIAEIWDQTYR